MSVAYNEQPDDDRLKQEQTAAQRAETLVRQLQAEEEEALGFAQTEVIEQQIEALKRYFGEPYGDEEDGRSEVTTREVFETIEWTRPDLMRVFSSGGNVVYLEESSPEDARYAKDAADYLSWMFFSDNPGFANLDDFAFDGLLHRRGYLACYWRDKEYRAPQTLTGLNIVQVQQLMQDPMVEIIGQDFDQESEAGGITLMVRRTKSVARAEIVSIAPEDMRLNGRAVTIDAARYVGRVVRMLRGEAMKMWPEKADDIRDYSGNNSSHGQTRRGDDVRQQRFGDHDEDWLPGKDAATEIEVLEEYLRIDLNDDGYPETIRSYRMGDLLLEESEVEENPFASWTPIRIPHRFMGLSSHDTTKDLQRQSTVITRAGLDALYQSVVNREAYNKNTVDLDTLLATYSGAKVAVDGDPSSSIMPLTGGLATAAQAWEALELLKLRMEDRTGATRQTRGLDADALTDSHSGVALSKLQLNADARKEMTARNMGDGLGALFAKLYRLVCRNQNEARALKIGGKWAQFDPRTWNSDLRVAIYAGGVNRDHTLMGLTLIGQEQEKVIEALGPGNPNVTSKNRYRYQEELCRIAGHKNAEPFFTEVPDEPDVGPDGQPQMDEQGQPKMKPWAPPAQPDPAMAKVEADTKAKQAEMAMSAQASQATQQLKTQEAQATLALQGQKDKATLAQEAQRAELTLQIMREKAALEAELARDKATAELNLAWAKMEQEAALAREQMEREYQLEMMKLSMQREMHTEKVDASVEMNAEKTSALSKNRPGGSLSE